MKNLFFKRLFCATVLSVLSLPAFAGVDWLENYDTAIKEAKKTSRPVFILFTNSYSCRYCIDAEENVFSTSAFRRFTKKEVVPLLVDYAPLYETGEKHTWANIDQMNENHKIPEDYKILESIKTKGWPYIVVISPDEKILHQACEREISDSRDFIKKYEAIILGDKSE